MSLSPTLGTSLGLDGKFWQDPWREWGRHGRLWPWHWDNSRRIPSPPGHQEWEQPWMSHLHAPLSILESALPKISSPVPPSQEFPRHRHTPWTAHSHFSVGWDCRNGLGWVFDPVPPCRDRDTSLCSSLEYFQGWGIKVDPLPLSQQLWDAPKGIHIPVFPFFIGPAGFHGSLWIPHPPRIFIKRLLLFLAP